MWPYKEIFPAWLIKMNPKLKLSIIIPVRNEGASIRFIIKILESVVETPNEVLVVYDFPEDNTVPAVKKMQQKCMNLKLVHNRLGKGVTNAIKSGVNESEGELIMILVADDLGPGFVVDDMVSLMGKGCDLVSCTRYAHGGRRLGENFLQRLLSSTGNKLFSLISGSALTDSTTGFKMFRRQVFDKINLEARIGWAVVFELAIKAQAAGMKLGEVPVVSIDRFYKGKSTFSLGPWFREYLRWFIWGIKNLHFKGKRPKLKVRIPSATVK